jgi:hypothetical protein
MADIGILPHVIESVLNHISGHKAGVAGVYNRSQYGPERRQALDQRPQGRRRRRLQQIAIRT